MGHVSSLAGSHGRVSSCHCLDEFSLEVMWWVKHSQSLSVCDFCCARLKVHLDPALPTMCLAEEFERDLSTLRTKYDACHIFQNVSGKFSPPRWIRRGRWRGRLPRPNAQDRTKSVEDFWGKRWEKGTHQYALHPLKSLSTRCELRCPIPNPMPDGFEIEP